VGLVIDRHYDVVCLSHLRWSWVWQRPQHLLTRCAATHRVFYVEEPVEDGDTRIEVTKVEAGVYVVRPHVRRALPQTELDAVQQTLLDELFVEYEIDDYLLWVYSPMAVTFAEHLKPVATVYDCMDELSLFAGAPPELRERERCLLETADLVFTGGASLFEAKRTASRNFRDAKGRRTVRPPSTRRASPRCMRSTATSCDGSSWGWSATPS